MTAKQAKTTATATPKDESSQGTSFPKAFQHFDTDVS
jgi:hypothetical protein